MAIRRSASFCKIWGPGERPREFEDKMAIDDEPAPVVRYPTLPKSEATSYNAYDSCDQTGISDESLRETTAYSDPIRPLLDEDPLPIFLIPRTALKAPADPREQYYSYELYESSSRQKVEVTYCQTVEESEECAQRFLNELVIGFDMEWRAIYEPGIKNNVSLIQIASEKEIALFHIARHKGYSPEALMAPSLRRIIESPYITKTGVAVWNADGVRLRRFFNIKPRGFFELSHLHRLITHGAKNPSQVNKRLVALAKLNLEHLELPLFKGPVRCADWAKDNLTDDEVRYAATDAYSGYQLFRVMNRKRLAMDPRPPLPAFAELGLPISLPLHRGDEKWSESDDLALDREGAKVYEALQSWTRQASRDSGHLESILVGDEVLNQIALLRPTTMDDLRKIHGPHQSDYALGVQLLRVARECRCAERSPGESGSTIFLDSFESAETSFQERQSAMFGDEEEFEGITDSMLLSVAAQMNDEGVKVGNLARDDSGSGSCSSQSTLKAEEAKIVDRKLLSALSGLRIKLASKMQTERANIASDAVLQILASQCPSTAAGLHKIDGAGTLIAVARSYGVSILDWINSYKSADLNPSVELIGTQLSQTTIAGKA